MECCGVLIGRENEILEGVRSPNRADDPRRRFLLDPAIHLQAIRCARSLGLAVIGFYHSHPASEPRPSQTDLECATYTDHLYLIVRPLAADCEARLFRLKEEGFVEVLMKVKG